MLSGRPAESLSTSIVRHPGDCVLQGPLDVQLLFCDVYPIPGSLKRDSILVEESCLSQDACSYSPRFCEARLNVHTTQPTNEQPHRMNVRYYGSLTYSAYLFFLAAFDVDTD